MGRELHGVDPRQGSNFVRPANDGCHIVYRAHGIGGVANCYEPGTFIDLRPHILHVQGHVPGMYVNSTNDNPSLLQRKPGSNIGVVIKGSYDDLVASLQCLADGAAEGEGEGGHIWTEDDLTWAGGMQEIGHCTASSSDHLVSTLAGDKSSLGVGIRLAEVGYHSVYDLLRHLGPTGVIEIDGLFVFVVLIISPDQSILANLLELMYTFFIKRQQS